MDSCEPGWLRKNCPNLTSEWEILWTNRNLARTCPNLPEPELYGGFGLIELGGDGCHQLVTADGRELFTLNLSELVQ